MGITQHIVGVRNVMDLANLQMLLGNMGKAGGSMIRYAGKTTYKARAIWAACQMFIRPINR